MRLGYKNYNAFACRHIRQDIHMEKPLFCAAPLYKYSFGTLRVFFNLMTRYVRLSFAVLLGQSKHDAIINPLIGSAREGFPEICRCCSCFASLVIPSFFCSMFKKHSKQMKGFGRKLLSRRRHLSLARVGRLVVRAGY